MWGIWELSKTRLISFSLIFSLFLSMCIAYECDTFKIYYYPLDLQVYIPLTPEGIEKGGLQIELTSCALTELFQNVNNRNVGLIKSADDMNLRIKIISNKDGKVVYITTQKRILSEGNKYNIDKKIVNVVLDEIITASKEINRD